MVRRSFKKCDYAMEPPSLMQLQIQSYEDFLQKDVPAARREDTGLQAVFKSVFPIYDFNKTVSLEFVTCIGKPKHSIKECRVKGLSYESALKVTVSLVFYDVTEDR